MELIILFAFAFWLGWAVHGIVIRSMMKSALRAAGIDPRELEQKLRAAIESQDEPEAQATVKIERHGDTLYAYEHPSDRFLGQHNDPKQLIQLIAQKFPTGTNVTIPQELGAEYMKT